MEHLVLASGNAGKLKEFQSLLAPFNLTLSAQQEHGVASAEETACTFVENALLKARHAAQATGHAALADDSGLCVDALGGEPGIYSARYGGEHGNSQKNIDTLLAKMQSVPQELRQAHFYCALVLVRHPTDPAPMIAVGQWSGNLLNEPLGAQGFGYDPIFYCHEHQMSAAQLPADIKNSISHRARACRMLCQQLNT